jgi:hypothetical protein
MASNKAFEQIGAMDLSTLANIATALTVLTALLVTHYVTFVLLLRRRDFDECREALQYSVNTSSG